MIRKLAHLEIPRFDEKRLEKEPYHRITLILENIRSAENVGSIFRTADAFRLEEIILVGISPTPDNSRLHRSALGSQDLVPWRSTEDITPILDEFETKEYTISALEITDQPKSAKSLQANDYPICLIVGNEVDGVSDLTLSRCDFALEIQQYGFKQSLNVAVATGICCSELTERLRELETDTSLLPNNPRD